MNQVFVMIKNTKGCTNGSIVAIIADKKQAECRTIHKNANKDDRFVTYTLEPYKVEWYYIPTDTIHPQATRVTNMSKQITISLIETVSHSFEFNLEDIPDSIDLEDADDMLAWATDAGKVDYSNGENIGEKEVNISCTDG